ncbi:MAG: hypothetical protein QOH31_2450 [Verrucomicrobiota bacterium]
MTSICDSEKPRLAGAGDALGVLLLLRFVFGGFPIFISSTRVPVPVSM